MHRRMSSIIMESAWYLNHNIVGVCMFMILVCIGLGQLMLNHMIHAHHMIHRDNVPYIKYQKPVWLFARMLVNNIYLQTE